MEIGWSADKTRNSWGHRFWLAGWLITILMGLGGCSQPSQPVSITRPASTPPAVTRPASTLPKNVEPVPVANVAPTPEQIERAIDKAVSYIYSRQKDGHWEIAPEFKPTPDMPGGDSYQDGNWGGLTATAVHALLVAGENANDPRLRPAVNLLLKWSMRMNPTALCQRDEVLQLLPRTSEVKKVAWQDLNYLTQTMRTVGEAKGFYFYYPGNDGFYIHSVSQNAVLAMRACDEIVINAPNGYWETTEIAWRRHQVASGGWGLIWGKGPAGEPSVSMTAAGVATLLITQDYVHAAEGLECKGNITNPAIDKGMHWLSTYFNGLYLHMPEEAAAQMRTLYDIERVGLAGGYKYIGRHDWYKEGAVSLLGWQNKDGSWGHSRLLSDNNVNNIPATCYALMFLARGREPVVFNKLQYDVMVDGKRTEGRWNQRPRDIAKVIRWIEKMTERDLNWRCVNLRYTPVDQMQDAPILYLSGDQQLNLPPEDEAKLKQFIEKGGMVLGNPDGDSKVFMNSFRALAARLYPQYEMRVLPADHPIYTHEQFRGREIQKKDALLGLSDGVRELIIMPTYDWAKAWQSDYSSVHQDSFRLADNMYLYTVGRTPFRHGGPAVRYPDPAINTYGTINLARLDYAGNADPEPGGWRRIAALLHNNERIDLAVQTVKLGNGLLNIDLGDAKSPHAKFSLAHMTGTTKITLMPAQRGEIKRFVEGGGTLLIDAAGGSPAFADAMELELATIFPKEAAQLSTSIPEDDALYINNDSGRKLGDWNYRRYVHEGEKRPKGPELRGIKIHDRWAVLFSRQDISNALVGRDVDGVVGYTAETATDLVIHLVKKNGRVEKGGLPISADRRDRNFGKLTADDIALDPEAESQRLEELERLARIARRRADPVADRYFQNHAFTVTMSSPITIAQAEKILSARHITIKQSVPLTDFQTYMCQLFRQGLFFCVKGTKFNGRPITYCVLIDLAGKITFIETPENIVAFLRDQVPKDIDYDTAYLVTKAYLIMTMALTGKATNAEYEVHVHPKSDGFEVFGIATPADKSGRIAVAFWFVDGKLRMVKEEREVGKERRILRREY